MAWVGNLDTEIEVLNNKMQFSLSESVDLS